MKIITKAAFASALLMFFVGCSEKKEENSLSQVNSVEQKPVVEVNPLPKPKPATFEVKTAFKKCAACHGSDGSKQALGKSDVIRGMTKDFVFESLKGYKAGTLNRHAMGPMMKSQVSAYSEEELEQLSEYISKL